ncbi:MAG: hypothetical protein B6U68_04030, partial [Candidatus Aenigmarchaeota archaeon ex4484_14]
SSIDISALSNIEIIQGQAKKVKVEIINDGEKDLTDVKLTLSGVPLALYKITTSSWSVQRTRVVLLFLVQRHFS